MRTSARSRAGAIWRIRFGWRWRHEPSVDRADMLRIIRRGIAMLREEGPGPVEPLGTVAPGPCEVRETWWGQPC